MTETSSSPPDLKDNTSQVNKVSNNVVSNEIYKTNPDNYNPEENKDLNKSTWHWLQLSIVCILKFLIFAIAVYLSWYCNQKEPLAIRILISILAGIFSEFYIIFYSVYRIYLGNKCAI
jgi:hypothetical protein